MTIPIGGMMQPCAPGDLAKQNPAGLGKECNCNVNCGCWSICIVGYDYDFMSCSASCGYCNWGYQPIDYTAFAPDCNNITILAFFGTNGPGPGLEICDCGGGGDFTIMETGGWVAVPYSTGLMYINCVRSDCGAHSPKECALDFSFPDPRSWIDGTVDPPVPRPCPKHPFEAITGTASYFV